MRIRILPFLLLAAALAPAAASAQAPSDVQYCHRLADLYDRYIGQPDYGSVRGTSTGSVDSQVAAAQCRQGNPAGIPVLEQVLKHSGFTLPPRG
jgi:hypothetical protein